MTRPSAPPIAQKPALSMALLWMLVACNLEAAFQALDGEEVNPALHRQFTALLHVYLQLMANALAPLDERRHG